MIGKKSLVVYQADSGAIELPLDATSETIWASQAQIAQVFNVNVRTVNEHLQNVFSTLELDKDATIRKFRIVQIEGGREVEREIEHYDLDAIISVGYRVNSKSATAFRKWATQTLRKYIVDGYTINPAQIQHNQKQFIKALEDLKFLSSKIDNVGSAEVTDLALAFATTWLSLDAYGKSELPSSGVVMKALDIGANALSGQRAATSFAMM